MAASPLRGLTPTDPPPMFHQSGLYRMTIGAYYGWWTGEPCYLAAM